MDVQERVARIVGQLLVEIEIFLIGYFARRTSPQRLLRVDDLLANGDWEGYIIRVLLDDAFQRIVAQELFGILFDVDHDISAARGFFGSFNSVGIAAVAGP